MIRLKRDAEPQGEASPQAAPAGKRRPLRHSDYNRQRARKPAAEGVEPDRAAGAPGGPATSKTARPGGPSATESVPRRRATGQPGGGGKEPADSARNMAEARPCGPRQSRGGVTPEGGARRRGRPSPPPAATRLHCFAPCPRGLEAELARELAEIGAEDIVPGSGGANFSGDLALAWRVNLCSRLAIRVLWRVGQGTYRSEDDLYQAARGQPWPDWFEVARSIAVRTVAHASPLKSLNFATLRIKDAVCDRFREAVGARPDVDARAPQVPILLYLDRDRYSLYLDLSGEPLNRRGYRVQPAAAPLNENLAAGLLRLAGWTPDTPLLDPMMGGGTILLEAAMMALNIPPGLKRHFAFEHLAGFDRVAWQRVRKDAEAAILERRPLPIHGSDIDPAMVRAAGLNLKAAGLLDCVGLAEADVLAIGARAPAGLIVSNPPYGVRLTSDQQTAFYAALGDALKQRFQGWSAWLLSADPELPRHIGLRASSRVPLYNGPLECRLYEYRLVAGGMRRGAPGD